MVVSAGVREEKVRAAGVVIIRMIPVYLNYMSSEL